MEIMLSRLPDGFELLASTANAPIAAMFTIRQKRFYAIQFHPRSDAYRRKGGRYSCRILCTTICGCGSDWTSQVQLSVMPLSGSALKSAMEQRIYSRLSGGVDSSVVAALLHRAIGDRLVCVFVDTGLLRKNEGDEVMATLGAGLGVRIERVERGAADFLPPSLDVSDPEEKRKRIGNLFIEIFEAVRWSV